MFASLAIALWFALYAAIISCGLSPNVLLCAFHTKLSLNGFHLLFAAASYWFLTEFFPLVTKSFIAYPFLLLKTLCKE